MEPRICGMLSVKELASFLRVSRKTVYGLCEQGVIPCYRVGSGRGTLRFDLVEVKASLKVNRSGGSSEISRGNRHLF